MFGYIYNLKKRIKRKNLSTREVIRMSYLYSSVYYEVIVHRTARDFWKHSSIPSHSRFSFQKKEEKVS